MPPPGYRFRTPWYRKPLFYFPVAIALLLACAGLIYFVMLASRLSAEAATFDLGKLEQMESASVIVVRNN